MKRFLSGIILILVFSVAFPGNAIAQSGDTLGWSPDERVPGYLDDTFTPFLLADQNGTVHAFATQLGKDADENTPKVIVYRRWTLGGGWTRPVEILLSPTTGDANITGAYLDAMDVIHVIFTATETLTRQTSVYHSSAPAIDADWAPAWSEPKLVGENALDLNSGAIIGDDRGNLVIIYSGNRDGNGVYSVHSSDFGRNWSDASPIFQTYDGKLSPYSIRLAIGPEQKIRAVWNVVTNIGGDEALYFSNYDSQTSKWDSPVELDRRIALPDYFGPSFPVIVDNGQEVVIVYNGGNPSAGKPVNLGRPIQRALVSTSGGLTWNEPLDPFPFHVGRSGEHTLVLDGSGVPHTLFVQRIEYTDDKGNYSIIGGVWHSMFQNDGWSKPDRFVTTVPPHDIRAAVVQGNVLLAVWREDPGTGQSGIWYSYSVLDLPELPLEPLATTSVDYSLQLSSTAIPLSNTAKTPEITPQPEDLDDAPPSNLGTNPTFPIVVGLVPVVLILVGMILGYRSLINRRE